MKSAVCTLAIGLFALNAHAEVTEKATDHFLIGFSARVEAPPAKVYVAISEVARWWSAEHTWSGKAENLSLKAEAGGCFCERWAEGSAEHGRVIMAMKNAMLRLDASLGPLQEYAVNGILTFRLTPINDDATELDVDYRVNGASGSGLDAYAPAVDGVLGPQIDRLLRYVDTGNPEPVEDDAAAAPAGNHDARAEVIEEWAKQAAAEQAANGAAKPKPIKPDAPPKP
ncbi:MAG: SRPBCC family protein [Dokdonella sp.]